MSSGEISAACRQMDQLSAFCNQPSSDFAACDRDFSGSPTSSLSETQTTRTTAFYRPTCRYLQPTCHATYINVLPGLAWPGLVGFSCKHIHLRCATRSTHTQYFRKYLLHMRKRVFRELESVSHSASNSRCQIFTNSDMNQKMLREATAPYTKTSILK